MSNHENLNYPILASDYCDICDVKDRSEIRHILTIIKPSLRCLGILEAIWHQKSMKTRHLADTCQVTARREQLMRYSAHFGSNIKTES